MKRRSSHPQAEVLHGGTDVTTTNGSRRRLVVRLVVSPLLVSLGLYMSICWLTAERLTRCTNHLLDVEVSRLSDDAVNRGRPHRSRLAVGDRRAKPLDRARPRDVEQSAGSGRTRPRPPLVGILSPALRLPPAVVDSPYGNLPTRRPPCTAGFPDGSIRESSPALGCCTSFERKKTFPRKQRPAGGIDPCP